MTDYTQVPVSSLVPHSAPMVLLDAVLEYGEKYLVAAVDIHPGCRFYDATLEGVPAWVSIEYMAQAISAWAGVQARQKGENIKVGFLLGSRKLLLPVKVLAAGQRYTVAVKQLLRDDSGLASFDCQVLLADKICVEARVNVYEVDDIKEVIEETVVKQATETGGNSQ